MALDAAVINHPRASTGSGSQAPRKCQVSPHRASNHAWVEALCGDTWHFLGACEPEPVLDRGWFITAASRAMLIHSRIFGEGVSPLHGELLGREGAVSWFNQTGRYARTKLYTFQALVDGKPAAGAVFRLQILTEASFHTIAVRTADEQGIARVALGQGSLHVSASLNGLVAEGACGEEGIVLHLTPPETGDSDWTDFDFCAPADNRPAPAVLSTGQKAERAETLRHGNELRQRRLSNFFQPGREGCEDLLRAARGNCGEIRAFLSGEDTAGRERLVRTLSDKDLRDVTCTILEDHFRHLPPQRADIPEDIYWNYIACPRISLEKLTPWRSVLHTWLTDWTGTPAALRQYLEEHLEIRQENLSNNLYWSPEAIPASGGCDEKSRRVLLIAALRTLGIPARLRPMDGAPEVWEDGRFHTVRPEEMGILRLTWTGDSAPSYRQSWTISRWTQERWHLLELSGEDLAALTLPAGRYRLVTTSRLPSGDQFAASCELTLHPGEERTCALRLRPWALEDLLSSRTLPTLSAVTLDGERISNLFQADGRPILALWLEEGGEPTEHVLNELMEHPGTVESLPIRVLFLVRNRESLYQPTLAKALRLLQGVRVLLDDWAYDLEAVARHLGRDPDSPPLAVVCDSAGQAVYSDCGYRVGAVELLLRVAAHLCREK